MYLRNKIVLSKIYSSTVFSFKFSLVGCNVWNWKQNESAVYKNDSTKCSVCSLFEFLSDFLSGFYIKSRLFDENETSSSPHIRLIPERFSTD